MKNMNTATATPEIIIPAATAAAIDSTAAAIENEEGNTMNANTISTPAANAPIIPVVERTEYANFIMGLYSEGNRSTMMKAKLTDSILQISLPEYQFAMADILSCAVSLTAKLAAKAEKKEITAAENALFKKIEKVFGWAGILPEYSDLYYFQSLALQMKRGKDTVDADGHTTAGKMSITGKTVTAICKAAEVLMGMHLNGIAWDATLLEFKPYTPEQLEKMDKRIKKYQEKKTAAKTEAAAKSAKDANNAAKEKARTAAAKKPTSKNGTSAKKPTSKKEASTQTAPESTAAKEESTAA